MPTTDEQILSYQITPIAIAHTPYKEKFGIPRQSGLVPKAVARLQLLPPFNTEAAIHGLADCSHLWLQFVFHDNLAVEPRAKVRPPRLGGNKKRGVFATRSPVRPNHLGLSVVALEEIVVGDALELVVSGADLLDKTPIVDIKPYLPYADCLPEARCGFANDPPERLPVAWSAQVLADAKISADTRLLIEQTLGLDPRPQYLGFDEKRYFAARIDAFDVAWRYQRAGSHWQVLVTSLNEETPREG